MFLAGVEKKCRDPGSNRGPLDLQSNALPTELSRPDENELAFPFSAGGDKVLSLGKKKKVPRPGIEPGTFRSSV